MKWLLTHFMALLSFNAPWKYQETSDFLMYFRKYKKRPVPGNGLKIFLINMSVKCWYSCLLHNRACFLTVDLHWCWYSCLLHNRACFLTVDQHWCWYSCLLHNSVLSYGRSALVLSMHSRSIKFQCFLI